MTSIQLRAPERLHGPLRVPGDKSISHRILIFAGAATGRTRVLGINRGEDVAATIRALRGLGVSVEDDGTALAVDGAGEFRDPAAPIDCGNSGTTMRVLAGLLAGRANAVLDGDESLRRRPMERVAVPLRAMGADVRSSPGGHAPLTLSRSDTRLHGITHELETASAQVKTAIMLAALRARGTTTISSPCQSRDHSELMLAEMGAALAIEGLRVRVQPSSLHALADYEVPGDVSSAAYFIAAATCVQGSRISVLGVGINPTRTAALDVMRDMGAHISIRGLRVMHGEPVADIEVSSAAPLRNVELDPARIPNLIDEIPLLCAVAATAQGAFVVRGAEELRGKESDRIASTVELLRAFGVAVTELPDGIAVRGGRPLRPPERIATGGDHRIGMTAAVLAAAAKAPIAIDDAVCIGTSFPGFEAAWHAAYAERG
ncbi:MAG TPA: 3-phosphoshikimate 1-carboxyvinyltransferase [Candidatus Eremiobacteraceae bacterium]|nr:3-phosphoshikimate 1-carboxyvinyltransferase [Candidatus Eremiobacteraceae bacterium]